MSGGHFDYNQYHLGDIADSIERIANQTFSDSGKYLTVENIQELVEDFLTDKDKAVAKTLEGKANVYFPAENCRFASYVLRYIHEYKSEGYVMGVGAKMFTVAGPVLVYGISSSIFVNSILHRP